MSEYYVGITIGPIIETLCMASRPASLWCASSMFSWLAEDICNKAIDIGGTIISPFYPNDSKKTANEYGVTRTGVGKYHDRIIFRVKPDNLDSLNFKVKQMIKDAKQALANELVTDGFTETPGQSKAKLQKVIVDYLQVRYVITEAKKQCNCILYLSPYLDAAELCPSFSIDQSIQPVMTLFEGKNDETQNEFVKKCFELKYSGNSIIKKINEKGKIVYKIRDIESIAQSVSGDDRKIYNYYAIVQADGDSMTKLLKNLHDDEAVNDFSKICLDYTSESANKINDFGGMTIYAGGDDLLFISPLENKNGKTVFELCSDINKCFQNIFKDHKNEKGEYVYKDNIPTLSFGNSINYKKFPLYEAFKDALTMLDEAKKIEKDEDQKNKTAVHIMKHSGQSVKFRYLNNGVLYNQLVEILKIQSDSVFLHSMMFKIDLYKPLLIVALKNDNDLEQTFNNIFDSGYHETVMNYIQTVRKCLKTIYDDVKENKNNEYYYEKKPDEKEKSKEEIALELLYNLLRTARFFSEKKGAK